MQYVSMGLVLNFGYFYDLFSLQSQVAERMQFANFELSTHANSIQTSNVLLLITRAAFTPLFFKVVF